VKQLQNKGVLMFVPGQPSDIIQKYKDMVYRIAFTQCKNPADAEDITQEVFIRYLKKKPEFFSEEHLKAWLIRVCINASKSLLRSVWFKKTVPLSEHIDTPVDEHSTTSTYTAVLSLPDKYRFVVLLYYFEGYNIKEIAGILGKTETAIQTQLQRARHMLKDKLKEEWEND